MKPYMNTSGNSGVSHYELRDDGIVIRFIDSEKYLYTEKSAGVRHIRAMKKLAAAGEGLATYINKFVRDRFERKL